MAQTVGDVVARNVRARRSWLRMRQQDVADQLGVSRPTLASIEAGRRAITVEDLPRLCAILTITLDELFAGVDEDQRRVMGLG
jgi:transcriptional regulator with XRE-family HTH domain